MSFSIIQRIPLLLDIHFNPVRCDFADHNPLYERFGAQGPQQEGRKGAKAQA